MLIRLLEQQFLSELPTKIGAHVADGVSKKGDAYAKSCRKGRSSSNRHAGKVNPFIDQASCHEAKEGLTLEIYGPKP